MIKYVYDHKYRKVVERFFLSAIFFILLIGLYNFLTINNLLISRLFVVMLISTLISGPVFLVSFKRKICIDLNPESIQLVMQSLRSFDGDDVRPVYKKIMSIPGNEVAQVHRYLDLGAQLEICYAPMDIICASAVKELLSYHLP